MAEDIVAGNTDIRTLAGRLIEAQDAERARIARELHDDASQQVAGLSIMISTMRRRLGTASLADLHAELHALQQRTGDLARSVRQVSQSLHPGILQLAGLVAALRTHCAEVERQSGLEVVLRVEGEFQGVPLDRALCLFRVTQEALCNTVRHAQAARVEVSLTRCDSHAALAVEDNGRGFDAATFLGGGLGLLSIRERASHAGGTVNIVSRLQQGTSVQIRIPIESQ